MYANDGVGELSLESEGGGKARDTSNGTALHGLRAAIVPQERESTFDECSVEDADNGVAQSSTRPGALTIENLGQHDSSAKSPAQSISAKSNLENHSTLHYILSCAYDTNIISRC